MRAKYKKYYFVLIIFILGVGIGIFLSFYNKNKLEQPKILFKQAKDILSKNKYEDAILILRLISEAYPESEIVPYSIYEIGKIQEYYLKDNKAALKYYKKVLKYKNNILKKNALKKINIYRTKKHNFYKDVVRCFPSMQDFDFQDIAKDVSLSDINLIIYDFPEWKFSSKLIFIKGKIYKYNKDYINAIKTFEYLIKKNSGLSDDEISKVYLEICDAYYKNKDYTSALKYLSHPKASSAKYKNIVLLGRGDVLYKLKRYKDAIKIYNSIPSDFFTPCNKLSEYYFEYNEPLISIAKCQEELLDFKSAILSYEKFLDKYEKKVDEIQKDNRNYYLWRTNRAKFYLANLYFNFGNLKLAQEYYKKINLSPAIYDPEEIKPKTLFAIGNIYLLQEKYKSAELIYKNILELFPKTSIIDGVNLKIAECKEKQGIKIQPEYYENIIVSANNVDVLIEAYYKFIKKIQQDLYSAGIPYYSLIEIEYITAQKYGKKIIDIILKEEKKDKKHYFVLMDINSSLLDFKDMDINKKILVSLKNFENAFSTIQTEIYKGKNLHSYFEYLEEKKKLYNEIKKINSKSKKTVDDYFNLINHYQNIGLFNSADKLLFELKDKDPLVYENFYKKNIDKIWERIKIKNEEIIFILENFFLKTNAMDFNILNLYAEELRDITINLIIGLRDYLNPDIYNISREIKWNSEKTELNIFIPPDNIFKKRQANLIKKIWDLRQDILNFSREPNKVNCYIVIYKCKRFAN